MSEHSAEKDAPVEDECQTVYVIERWQRFAQEWSDVSVGLPNSTRASEYARLVVAKGLGPVRIVKVHTHVTRTVIDQTRVTSPEKATP